MIHHREHGAHRDKVIMLDDFVEFPSMSIDREKIENHAEIKYG
jgi:hypothetical protein